MFMRNRYKAGRSDTGILCEMKSQEGDERPEAYNDEEWQTGNTRRMPQLGCQDVWNWEGITIIVCVRH